ncbi:MAG: hypothetical protein MZV70_57045 [Desulfobacterales bacterium]|nr:hypothetical protein [Desulfobacterales bacterium]
MDGNEFIDYMCAYGPMILGYANDKVDDAYRKTGRPRFLLLHRHKPVRGTGRTGNPDQSTGPTGSCSPRTAPDATSMAIMLARGYTKRTKIVLAEEGLPRHPALGRAPTTVGITAVRQGRHPVMVPWGDLNAFRERDCTAIRTRSPGSCSPRITTRSLPTRGCRSLLSGPK